MINMIKQQYDQMLNFSIIWRQISIKENNPFGSILQLFIWRQILTFT